MDCVFCHHPELNYKPDKSADLICSQCVQLLIGATQDELKRAYEKALSLSKQPIAESNDKSLRAWKNEIQEKNIRFGLSFPYSEVKALQKIYRNKAKAIESFLNPEEINARETKKHQRNMGRKRPVRAIRPSRNQIRTQPTTV